jgi:hypothetical protein
MGSRKREGAESVTNRSRANDDVDKTVVDANGDGNFDITLL